MPTTMIALLRGINVGKAKRVAMADLRALLAELGYGDIRTLLNSGNAVFSARSKDTAAAGRKIEKAVAELLGVTARTLVVSAADLAAIVAENTLAGQADNPSRLLVMVWEGADAGAGLAPLLRQDWTPEALAVGSKAAYCWCPDGILESPLLAAVGPALGDTVVTARNWATILKLHALANPG